MVLVWIIFATLAAGIGSVWVAALLLRLGWGKANMQSVPQRLLSLAAGALLATAFMHLLPEAFESSIDAHDLFTVLLVGVVFFFLLDKAELWHHGHEHAHEHGHIGHTHTHATAQTPHTHDADKKADTRHHDHHHHARGGWGILTGDSVHCFGDGILIASAFMADIHLGLIAAASVFAHEVPHHMGDLVVLRLTSPTRRAALLKVSMAGAVTALGGLAGYLLVGQLHDGLPYFLVVASSSFIYVALADLIPQLQKRLPARDTLVQIAWLLGGVALVKLTSVLAHTH